MDSATRELLRRARQRLENIDPYDWDAVIAWTASVRPLLVAAVPEQVDGFDSVTATPRWTAGVLMASTDRYGRRQDNFAQVAAMEEKSNRKMAAAAQQRILATIDAILCLPEGSRQQDPMVIIHNHGEAQVGDKYTTNITGATMGAVAVGPGAAATGRIEVGAQFLTQAAHRKAVAEAQAALVHDQDALEQLDARLFDALNQFLRLARSIEVEQKSLTELQAAMKQTLDDVWAEHVAKGMRPQLLPKALEVASAVASNPIMAEVVRRVIGP